jgi:Tfp pilus assembly protein PilF
MALGEAYYHLVPSRLGLDSLAEAAYQEANRLEPDFFPALYHLVELALRRGDADSANHLAESFRRSVRDSVENEALLLMVNCARGKMDSSAWLAVAHRDYSITMDAAKTLAGAPRFMPCAEHAFGSVLASDSASVPYRFYAVHGLYEVLLAQGRDREARALAATRDGARFHLDQIFYLQSAAGLGFEREAAELARSQPIDLPTTSSTLLWERGVWEAHRGDPALARRIAARLLARADSNRNQVDRPYANLVLLHVMLATGDTAQAVRQLTSMVPTGNPDAIAWSPWESLGLERLTLARVLFERGDYEGVIRAASTLDAPAPIFFLLFRPASLRLRLRAARALGRTELVKGYEARLTALGIHELEENNPEAPKPAR